MVYGSDGSGDWATAVNIFEESFRVSVSVGGYAVFMLFDLSFCLMLDRSCEVFVKS
jgi:hypothetical protein